MLDPNSLPQINDLEHVWEHAPINGVELSIMWGSMQDTESQILEY